MMGMVTDHVAGRLAFLKAELEITDAQMPKWDAFVEAVRAAAKTTATMWQSMMPQQQQTLSARVHQNVKALTARLEALQKVESALDPLYSSLAEQQKRTADQLMVSPMGMMGMM